MTMKAAWGYDFEPYCNAVDMYMRRIRLKLDRALAEPLGDTVPRAKCVIREPAEREMPAEP